MSIEKFQTVSHAPSVILKDVSRTFSGSDSIASEVSDIRIQISVMVQQCIRATNTVNCQEGRFSKNKETVSSTNLPSGFLEIWLKLAPGTWFSEIQAMVFLVQ
jgi:hypothetical protein